MQGSDCCPYLIEQFWLAWRHDGFLQVFGGFMFTLRQVSDLDNSQEAFMRHDRILRNVNLTST